MNAIMQPASPATKRFPRPPAVGEEVKKFHDTSHYNSELCKPWNMEFQKTSNETCERSTTPSSERCAETLECGDNSTNNTSPPPPYKWAQSLLCLLEDIQGVALFQQFLKQEGQDTKCLSFWFACHGVKKTDPSDRESLMKLINVVFEKKVKRISAIKAETKEEIKQKIVSQTGLDNSIFDAAQREVEIHMMNTTYPSFLKSDLYVNHLASFQTEPTSEMDTIVSSEAVDFLPTVHEDVELHIPSNKVPLTKENLLHRSKISSVSKLKNEGPAGYLASPYSYSSYHSKYGSYLPASAQDSELQSLSSDAQTDDTMSVTDSGLDDSLRTRKQKRQQKIKHSSIVNKEKCSTTTFIPRTERLPSEAMQKPPFKDFHAELCKKLNKVLDEQRVKQKIYEKLEAIETAENARRERTHKLSSNSDVEPPFLFEGGEDNVQDILDQHISRVFKSGQQTPALSPGHISPAIRPDATNRTRVPPIGINCESLEVSFGAPHRSSQMPQYTIPNSIRQRRDPDSYSTDSAVVDYVSDDNLPSSHRSQHSVGYESSDRRSRDQRRHISKKLSSMTGSSSSFVDSGISVAGDSVLSYTKVTHWLETKRMSETEKEHVCRNSSASPVLSRSSCKPVNNPRCRIQDSAPQWSYAQQETAFQNLVPADTFSNLQETSRRLEDESRIKMKLKCASGDRYFHDVSKMKYSKGCETSDDGVCHRKLRKSYPMMEASSMHSGSNDVTVVGYSYGRHSVPYLSKLPGKNITLKQFKSLLSKKGDFRYFFKTASKVFGTGVVFEEVNDEYKVLPMWEGKVFCIIESMENSTQTQQ